MKLVSRAGRLGVAASAGISLFFACAFANAQTTPDCATLTHPIYLYGGNSPKPLIKGLATALANSTPAQTLIFQSPGACLGINAVINSTTITGTASFWTTAGVETTCNLSLTGDTVQIGVGNNYPAACPEVTNVPSTFGDYLGPVQAFDFIVPKASSQTNISAAAAYFVFGFGANGQAAPWTNEAFMYHRNSASAVGLLIAQAINVPIAKFLGIDGGSNSTIITDVATSTNPEATIGTVSDEVAQAAASTVTVLAYQHYGQTCGYWPNSTSTSLDKRNVRDGHYYIWSNQHFYATKDNTGKPVDPDAKNVIGYFTGDVTPPSNVNLLKIEIQSGAVPDCAMEVKRTSDLGSIESYAPAAPCSCAFEFYSTGATSCTACGSNTDCGVGAPNCRYGYCEVN